MRPWYFRSMIGASLVAVGLFTTTPAQTAPWLAPAADEQIRAEWVQDVAKALKSNRFKNVFMNQPFGCDQCRILGYLNDAAESLDGDNPKLAKSFVRRALRVLDDGLESGWYSERDVNPIKRVIIQKAKQGFKESDAGPLAISPPRDLGPDPRYERGRDPLFSLSGETKGGGRYREGDPYAHDYGDRLNREQRSSQRRSGMEKGEQSGGSANRSREMSRRQFREQNQWDDDGRFSQAEKLKESANEAYDHDPLLSWEGEIRQPGD